MIELRVDEYTTTEERGEVQELCWAANKGCPEMMGEDGPPPDCLTASVVNREITTCEFAKGFRRRDDNKHVVLCTSPLS